MNEVFEIAKKEFVAADKAGLKDILAARKQMSKPAYGLDKIFLDAGFEWREPGCSMCLGMNPDYVPEGVHCASTSNRNFEGRQGFGARTHLCSPAMAAAAAIAGKFVDVRQLSEVE